MRANWHLVVSVCFFMPVAGAMATAKVERTGPWASLILITVSLALGFACAWTLHRAGVALGNQMRQQTGAAERRTAIVLNAGVVLWMMMTLLAGLWLSAVVTRHLG